MLQFYIDHLKVPGRHLYMASREVEEADAERLFLSVGYAPEKAECAHIPPTITSWFICVLPQDLCTRQTPALPSHRCGDVPHVHCREYAGNKKLRPVLLSCINESGLAASSEKTRSELVVRVATKVPQSFLIGSMSWAP